MDTQFPGHGSVRAVGKWRVSYYIGWRQAVGIDITVSNAESRNPEDFVASIQTCNAKQDWKPFWQEFNLVLDSSPFKS
jgi:hypothetical protein